MNAAAVAGARTASGGQAIQRVLLVGTFRSSVALEWAYLRAFRSIGLARVDTYDVEPYGGARALHGTPRRIADRIWGGWQARERSNRLLDVLADSQRQYDLILVFKGRTLRRKTLDEARRRQSAAIWANLNPDDPFNLETRGSSSQNVIEALPFFDLHFTWSRRLVQRLAEEGARRAVYLPFGYDPEAHREPEGVTLGSSDTVCFIGSWDPEREALLSELTDFKLVVLGSAWDRLEKSSPVRRFVLGGEVGGDAFCRPIASAAVSLNMLRPQNRDSHNMRTFEIPAAGGLLLTNRTPEQQEVFPDRVASLMYQGVEELKECVRLSLSAKPLPARIRNEGRRRVEQHTYEMRSRSILAEVESLRGGR